MSVPLARMLALADFALDHRLCKIGGSLVFARRFDTGCRFPGRIGLYGRWRLDGGVRWRLAVERV